MVSIWVLYFTHLTTCMSPTVVKDKVELFKQDTMLHVSYDNVSMSTNVTRCHQTQWYRVTIMMAHCIIRALYFGHLKQVIVRMTYVTRVELIQKSSRVFSDYGTWMPVLHCHSYTIQNMLMPSCNSNQILVPAGFQQSYYARIQVFIPSGPVGSEV